MNGSLSLEAIQAAYQQTRRGGLSVIAKQLMATGVKVTEAEVAYAVAQAILREERRIQREGENHPGYRIILKRVFLKSGPRTEGIREEIIERGLIQKPTPAERGHKGGLAKHNTKPGRQADPSKKATKKPAAPKKTTEEKLLERLNVIPWSGTLIDHIEMDCWTVPQIREHYQLDGDDEGWRLLLAFRGLTNHPYFVEPERP
ncbi:MAG: hypothetical protein ABIB97_06235 [Patescibacteria group bacterium]